MKQGIILTMLFYMACGYTVAFSQSKETVISGRVTCADDSSPLEGVLIVVKGTKNLTGTMPDGAFSLPVSQKDTVLLVSLAGYETKEIKLGKENYYEIGLKHTTANINDVPPVVFQERYEGYINR
jgi:CarboxypepD_reg-like domain